MLSSIQPIIFSLVARSTPVLTCTRGFRHGGGQGREMTSSAGDGPNSKEPEMKGWLQKWTNYLKGYQKRWFVLSNGTLSYYR